MVARLGAVSGELPCGVSVLSACPSFQGNRDANRERETKSESEIDSQKDVRRDKKTVRRRKRGQKDRQGFLNDGVTPDAASKKPGGAIILYLWYLWPFFHNDS